MKRFGKQFAVVLSILFVLFFAVGCKDKSDGISVPVAEPEDQDISISGNLLERYTFYTPAPASVSEQERNAVLLHSGNNSITVPDGKSLYVFAANIPEAYNDRNTETHFTVTATDYRTGGPSRSLIPSQTEISSAGSIEDAMKSIRRDVWYFQIGNTGRQTYKQSDMKYLCMGDEVVYYVQKPVFSDDKIDYLKLSRYLDGMISDSNGKCLLKAEREITGLKTYDVDRTGYFHILFTDFGESSIGENTGIAGAYDLNQIRQLNDADMFYINTRFVVKRYNLYNESESFWKYVTEHDDEILEKYGSPKNFLYLQVAYDIVSVLLHEYCHCLMDCNRYLKNGLFLNGSLFWIEGTANIVPYWMTGEFKDAAAVKTWIGLSEDYSPNFTSLDRTEAYEYATYGAGPLFFSFIANHYGEDTLRKFLHYSKTEDEDVRNVVEDCTGKSFEDVYKAFLLEMISSCGSNVRLEDSKGNLAFIKDWGFTLENLEKQGGIYTFDEYGNCTGYGDKFVWKSEASYSNSLHQLGWSLTKWEGSPSVLTVTGDVLCYALYI